MNFLMQDHRWLRGLGLAVVTALWTLPTAVEAASLMITSAYPEASTGKLYIYGEGFGSAAAAVKFAGLPVSVLSNSDVALTVSIPYGLLNNAGTYLACASKGPGSDENSCIGVAVGQQGPKGDKGDTGVKGDTGPAGATGPKGDTGPQGIAGPQGDTGLAGAMGPQGPKGDKGDRGLQGPVGAPGQSGIITAIYTAQQTGSVGVTGLNWTSVPGATINFSLPQSATVDLEANGSVLGMGGGDGGYSSHCGLRFVVDHIAYGAPDFGDVIVGCATGGTNAGFWTPWFMRRTLHLEAGYHAVAVQQTGWAGTIKGCWSEPDAKSAARFRAVIR